MISNKASEAAAEDGNEAKAEAEAFERRIKKLEAEKSELSRKLQEKSNALQELVSQVRLFALKIARGLMMVDAKLSFLIAKIMMVVMVIIMVVLVRPSYRSAVRPSGRPSIRNAFDL